MKQDKMNTFFDDISPDSEQRERMLSNILREASEGKDSKKRSKSFSVIAFAAALLLITTAAFAATNGGFEWLLEQFNPSFGELAVKVEKFSVAQDIKVEVIGAQMYETQAVVYLSIQDISGQNRVTERTSFEEGFYVKSDKPKEANSSGYGWHTEKLGFDEETNTLYIEITLDSDWPLSYPLTLGSERIYFDIVSHEYEPVDIDLSKAAETETIPVTEDQSVSGSIRSGFNGEEEPEEILKPGYYGPMPHGDERQWISNIGIIDGYLHVQVISVYGEFGPGDANINLISKDGEEVWGYDNNYFADKDGNILHQDDIGEDNIAYKYADFRFYDADIEKLKDYSLCYSVYISYGTLGDWEVAAYTGDSSNAIRRVQAEINTEEFLIEQITLTPLGLRIKGEGKSGVEDRFGGISAELSTVLITENGEIDLGVESVSWNSKNHSIEFDLDAEGPLDVSAVTAIRINGVTVEVK